MCVCLCVLALSPVAFVCKPCLTVSLSSWATGEIRHARKYRYNTDIIEKERERERARERERRRAYTQEQRPAHTQSECESECEREGEGGRRALTCYNQEHACTPIYIYIYIYILNLGNVFTGILFEHAYTHTNIHILYLGNVLPGIFFEHINN